jgi:hypothetical protein
MDGFRLQLPGSLVRRRRLGSACRNLQFGKWWASCLDLQEKDPGPAPLGKARVLDEGTDVLYQALP